MLGILTNFLMNSGGEALGGLGLGRLDVIGALRAGDVEDDFDGLLVFVFLDGGHGVEKLTGDVGEDGGASGGDFVLGKKKQQAREKGVDLDGIGEVVKAAGEGSGNFSGIGMILQVGMAGAEAGVVGSGVETATATVGEAVVTASGRIDGAGFSGLLGHVWFSFWSEMEPPRRRKNALARHATPGVLYR